MKLVGVPEYDSDNTDPPDFFVSIEEGGVRFTFSQPEREIVISLRDANSLGWALQQPSDAKGGRGSP